jgi:hypothetical protein
MPENLVARTWREELLYFYLKPPVCNLFVEKSMFGRKGFEMIEYIDKYFNPSGAVNFLGYIFDLINIKQVSDKPVVTLKACFSRVFASLKMGGVDIGLGGPLEKTLHRKKNCGKSQFVVQPSLPKVLSTPEQALLWMCFVIFLFVLILATRPCCQTPAVHGLEELFSVVLERFLVPIHALRVYCKN